MEQNNNNNNNNKPNNNNNKIERIIKCPHCNDFISIIELNCKIFRHGTYKYNGEQIPPHSTKDYCDGLVERGLIYGCGKPFRIIIQDNFIKEQSDDSIFGNWKVEQCDYI
jgi:hypothetical protein